MKAPSEYPAGPQFQLHVECGSHRFELDLHDVSRGAWRFFERDDFDVMAAFELGSDEVPCSCVGEREAPIRVTHLSRLPYRRACQTERCLTSPGTSRQNGQFAPCRVVDAHRSNQAVRLGELSLW